MRIVMTILLSLLMGCSGISHTSETARATHQAGLGESETHAAKEILDAFRRYTTLHAGVSNYEFQAALLNVLLRKAGRSLEDIGSSQLELEQTRVMVYLYEARKLVQIMRGKPADSDLIATRIRSLASRAGFSPRMAGTTEAELRSHEFKRRMPWYPDWWSIAV